MMEYTEYMAIYSQPPSGGCVLKHNQRIRFATLCCPAAFRRLCVETRRSRRGKSGSAASRLQAAVC